MVFIVQDRRLLACVPRLEAALGAVKVIERIPGTVITSPSDGQFNYAKLLRADGIGVVRYAGNVLYTSSVSSTQTIMQTCKVTSQVSRR